MIPVRKVAGLTFGNVLGKVPWSIPVVCWTVSIFWRWFMFRMLYDNEVLLQSADLKGFGQLSCLKKRNGIEKLHDISLKVVENWPMLQRSLSLTTITPGILLGYWDAFENTFLSKSYQGIHREWKAEVETPGEEVKKVDNWSDFFTEKETATKLIGYVKIADWRNLPMEKWSATTVWAYITDELRTRYEYKTKALNTKNRKGITLLLAEHSAIEVYRAAMYFVQNFKHLESVSGWTSVSPNLFSKSYFRFCKPVGRGNLHARRKRI